MKDADKLYYKMYAKTQEHLAKVRQAEGIIKQALAIMKNPYVAYSTGKDSQAMLHLILKQKPDIAVYSFSNGELDFQDTHILREKIKKEWNLNMIVREPPKNFARLLDDDAISYLDVYYDTLKEEIAKNKWDGGFVGKRKEEAFKRRKEIDFRGVLFFDDSTKVMLCYPLAEWSVIDIWAYIIGNNIPYNAVYDKENYGFTHRTLRLGIMFDVEFQSQGLFAWMKYNYPNTYNEFMLNFPKWCVYS